MPKKKIFHDSDSEVDDIEPEDVVESDEGQDDLVVESDDDSDAAPDDVTFSQSKSDALRKVQDALATIGKEKERQKQKRRQKDDHYKDQKKQKLEALSQSRLPEDFLQTISSAPVAVEPERAGGEEAVRTGAQDDSVEEGSEGGVSLSDQEEEGEADFIPLGDSQVRAVYVKDQGKLVGSAPATAFRDQKLYGGKIKRCTEKTRKSISAKRRARFR